MPPDFPLPDLCRHFASVHTALAFLPMSFKNRLRGSVIPPRAFIHGSSCLPQRQIFITHCATPYFKTVCSYFFRPRQKPPPARLIFPTAFSTQHAPLMPNRRYACCTRNFLKPAHRHSLPRNYFLVLVESVKYSLEAIRASSWSLHHRIMLGLYTRYMADRGGRRLS